MEFNWEDFKNGGIRVNCTTEEDAKKFIDMCYENGIYWYFDNNYETYWSIHKKNTYYSCINGKLVYGDISCEYYRETCEFKDIPNINIEEDNKMELKEGMIIECRNGNRYLLRTACGELVASSNDEYINLDYDEELNENKYFDKYFNKDFDVMKIYTSKAFILNSLFNDKYLECIWERKEPKKMTLAQISKALGYEVEVIDNE